MTKIKICGITRIEDALLCADLGADFIGFIFVPESARYIAPESAAKIVDQLRLKSSVPRLVGVFRNESAASVRRIASRVGIDRAQLHGEENDNEFRELGIPVIESLRVSDALPDARRFPGAEWLLFDTWDEQRGGGTGRRFDWSLLSSYQREKPFFLAGGVRPENVEEAIDTVHPDAIDVGSGVEREPGIKDHQRLHLLFERVRRS